MSNRNNPRTGDEKRTEHGPRWENSNPGAGCNSTHVARSRAKWKRRISRCERRTSHLSRKFVIAGRPRTQNKNEKEE